MKSPHFISKVKKILDLYPLVTMVSCLAGRTFLASNPGVPKSLGLPASALSLDPRPHGGPRPPFSGLQLFEAPHSPGTCSP